jgi:hypothetical protein
VSGDGGLVPVYLTVAVRTSGGNGPGVVRVPPDEAGRICADRHGVMGECPPRGYLDGGAPGSVIAAMIPRRAPDEAPPAGVPPLA